MPSLLTGAAIVASMVLLSLAARSLPIGTAYAIWVALAPLVPASVASVCSTSRCRPDAFCS